MRAPIGSPGESYWKARPAPDRGGEGATFNVTWNANCEAQPAGTETAMTSAAGIWGGLVSSPVTIEVMACWTSALPCDGIACGDTTLYSRNFDRAPMVDTYYPIAMVNALSGADLAPASPDIMVYFDATVDWSFDTGRQAQTGIDFVSVAMHELGHGLGFVGNMYESYNVGFCGSGPLPLSECPTSYDRFAVDSLGISLLSYLSPDPRNLGARLKSDANFGGPNVVARYGDWAKLYTPAIWDLGSSLSHLDQETFGDGENGLMTPSYSSPVQSPGPVALAMFQDMGWLLEGTTNVSTSGPPAVGLGHEVFFEADLVWDDYASQPITYTWTATDQTVITNTNRGITDSVQLGWETTGLKTMAVTATGAVTPASATRSTLVFDVGLTGPALGEVDLSANFTARLSPGTTLLPITYHWDASNQDSITHADQGTTDVVAFTWTVKGTQTVTVTTSIGSESVQAAHEIGIEIEETTPEYFVYLPMVTRQ